MEVWLALLVAPGGAEPPPPGSCALRANQLSYGATSEGDYSMVLSFHQELD